MFNWKLFSTEADLLPYVFLDDIKRAETNMEKSESKLFDTIDWYFSNGYSGYNMLLSTGDKFKLKDVAEAMSSYFARVWTVSAHLMSTQNFRNNEKNKNYKTFRAMIDAYEKSEKCEKHCKQVVAELLSMFNDKEKDSIAEYLIKKWQLYYVYLNKEDFGQKYTSIE